MLAEFSLGSTLDLEKLFNVDGVSVRALIMARQRQSISVEQISDPQAPQLANVQANYGRGNSGTRLAELSIEKNLVTQLPVFELGVLLKKYINNT